MFWKKITILTFLHHLTLLLLLVGHAESDQQIQNSHTRLLKKMLQHYDVNEWPDSESDQPTVINVQMFINSFGSLNAADMDFTVDIFLRQTWLDPRLALTGSRDQITIRKKEMQSQIWTPDTYFHNVKNANIHMVTMPNIQFRVNRTGHILYSMRTTLKLSCNMDFNDYPFDKQHCGCFISAYANTDDIVQYRWVGSNPIDLPDDLEIAQFDLIDYNTELKPQELSTGNFSGLIANFHLKRQNGFHILQTYVPTVLIVSISWVSFWLDPNVVPGRVTLGVTTLLTLTTLSSGIRAQLPPVSYIKAIDVWMGMCMIMVFGALLEFTLVNWLANKKKIHQEVSTKDESAGTTKPRTYIAEAICLDAICRALFPAAFLLFNIVYWPYYMHHEH